VNVEVFRDGAVDEVQELAELGGAVARCHVGDHMAGCNVEGCVQVGGAVAFVVVGLALRDTGHHRQNRGSPIQRLDLGLLIDTEHNRGVGRVEIQADNVADLVDELGIGLQLEIVDKVGFETERPPDAADC
jgi:hypothetical protein